MNDSDSCNSLQCREPSAELTDTMGDMPVDTAERAFTIKDAPVENLRPLKVIVVGAGYSGILAAIRIPERLRNVELVVYEKNEAVGGVWYGVVETCLPEWC